MNTPVKHYHFKSVDSTMNVAKALALGETPTSPGSLVGAHSLPRDAGSCSKACAPRWLQTIAATIARCIPCRTASGTGPRIGKVDINSPQLSDLAIITADEQTAGRGRFDRRWHSGKGAGLYVTYQFSIPAGSSKMNGFSLAVGVAVKRALSKFGVQAQLKWPNDVVVFNEQRELCKLAGILVDLVSMGGADGEKLYVSTGIGLNLKKTS